MAQKRDRLRIAVIGLGEAGATFAKGFLVSGLFDVVGYDARIENPSTAEGIRARAESFGIAACASLEQASRDADIILSAVTASAARKVAETAATFLKRGQFYFDINSISPSAKRRNAVAIERSGAAYVEGAVMGPVGPVGIKVEILLAGACAAELAAMLTPAGMNLKVVATAIGKAPAIKMCRSIVIKGIEALVVECFLTARRYGIEDTIIQSLNSSFPGTDCEARLVYDEPRASARTPPSGRAARGCDDDTRSGVYRTNGAGRCRGSGVGSRGQPAHLGHELAGFRVHLVRGHRAHRRQIASEHPGPRFPLPRDWRADATSRGFRGLSAGTHLRRAVKSSGAKSMRPRRKHPSR